MSFLLRFAIALLLGFGGIYFLQSDPQLPQKIVAFTAIALGFITVATRQRKTVLRIGTLTWTREELCRHILITGDTGCGKTSSGFNTILVRLTRSLPDWGGLAVGVKGDEGEFLQELLTSHGRDRALVTLKVRPANALADWQPPHRFNLLSDRSLPWMAHAKAIVDTASSLTEGRQDAFFKPMAQIALSNALQLLEETGQPVTLTRAYHLLTTERILKNALELLENKEPTASLIYPLRFLSTPPSSNQRLPNNAKAFRAPLKPISASSSIPTSPPSFAATNRTPSRSPTSMRAPSFPPQCPSALSASAVTSILT